MPYIDPPPASSIAALALFSIIAGTLCTLLCRCAMMDRSGLIAKLQELNIACETVEHPAVMTCEAQVAELQDVPGVVAKNLFLKDKKSRLYLVTAAADTKVDLRVLSARLGTGKGGVRLAPDELLGTVLQVPLGSCTPLALCQPTAANVVLLLDQKLKSLNRIIVHPLENTASTVLSAKGLETFIRSLGREPLYVDLEADPVVNKENPPDLKAVADAAVPYKEDEEDGVAGTAPAAAQQPSKPASAAAPAAKKPATASKAAPKAAAAGAEPRGGDVQATTDSVIQKVLGAALGEAAAGFDADVLRRLTADVAMELNALRNAAYANGFTAAKGVIAGAISGQFA